MYVGLDRVKSIQAVYIFGSPTGIWRSLLNSVSCSEQKLHSPILENWLLLFFSIQNLFEMQAFKICNMLNLQWSLLRGLVLLQTAD